MQNTILTFGLFIYFTEPSRVKVKTRLKSSPQTSKLTISSLETTDSAFFKCQASNDIDTISSQAIVKVTFGKVNLNGRGNHHDDEDDDIGLLPETYSSPDFPGMSNVEFEGGVKPSFDNMQNNNQQNQGGGQLIDPEILLEKDHTIG